MILEKRSGKFLQSVETGRFGIGISQAFVWDSLSTLRRQIDDLELDENRFIIQQVTFDDEGMPQRIVESPIRLYSAHSTRPIPLDFKNLLIDLCWDLEENGFGEEDPAFETWLRVNDQIELLDWWREHKTMTEAGREKLRREALALLTNEQKKVLGLTDDEEEGD